MKVNQKLEAEIIKRTASVVQLLDSVQSAVSELCVFLQIATFSSRYNLTRPILIPSQESRPQGVFWSLILVTKRVSCHQHRSTTLMLQLRHVEGLI